MEESIMTTPRASDNEAIVDGACFLNLLRTCLSPESRGRNLIQTPGSQSSGFEAIGDSTFEKEEKKTPSRDTVCIGDTGSNSMRLSPNQLQIRVLPLSREEAWEVLEDKLLIILDGRLDKLDHFKSLHQAGMVQPNLLRSLAFLASKPNTVDESVYFKHISTVASFLSIGGSKREMKLSVVKTLMTCLSPGEARWQTQEQVVEATLDFITRRSVEWEFLDHSESILIWELRAMCLRLLDREQERVAQVAKSGDTAAVMIAASAKLVEEGMNWSVPVISGGIEQAGEQVKGWVKTNDYPLIVDRDAVVAMTFSNAAKRASLGAREGTLKAVSGIRDVSARGIGYFANKIDRDALSAHLSPEGLEVLRSAGKVGMATIGATAIVGEAMLETSRAVVQKAAEVTADVVEHKYGTTAGQIINDAGETAGNLLRTVGHVAMLESKILTKSVAKNAGKAQVDTEVSKMENTMRLLGKQARVMMNPDIALRGANLLPACTTGDLASLQSSGKIRHQPDIPSDEAPLICKQVIEEGECENSDSPTASLTSLSEPCSSLSGNSSTTTVERRDNRAGNDGSHRSNGSNLSQQFRDTPVSRRSNSSTQTVGRPFHRIARRSKDSKRRGGNSHRKRIPLTPDTVQTV